MLQNYIDVKLASELTGETERTIRRKAEDKKYTSKVIKDAGAGQGGTKLKILVSSLPASAQLKFLNCESEDESLIDIDLVAYKEKYGDKGLEDYLFKYNIVQQALEIEVTGKKSTTELKKQLAESNGISKRTLDSLVSGYKEFGAKHFLKKVDRKDKGKTRSTCPAAKVFIAEKRLEKKCRRSITKVMEMVNDHAETTNADYCNKCIFNKNSKARQEALETGMDLVECEEINKNGMKVSGSLATIKRIVDNEISDEVYTYAVMGKKAWEAKYMHKATREKPKLINDVWFGDHHVLDVFIKDTKGKLVKPCLTAWYDGASGCMVGWCLNTNPNSKTIAEAFCYGVMAKKDFIFEGLPTMVYTDNGKDYRSHAFEGGKVVDKSFGKGMQFNIETDSLLKQLGIENTHAKAYHGWAKPVERFFGTFADRYVRELPGWCGRHPDERPDDFEKRLKQLDKNNKLLTMEELRTWFISVMNEYHNTEHSGYGNRKPIDIYQNGEKARTDKLSWAVLSLLKMEQAERKVTTQGITFNNRLYWNIELAHLAHETVKIRYNKENQDVLIVIHEGKFVCAATIKENLKMIREDEDKISQHIASQKRQEHDVKDRIAQLTGKIVHKSKKSESNMLIGEIEENNNSNITSIQHEKAIKEYKKANKKTKLADEDGVIDEKLLELGKKILNKQAN